MLDGKDYFLIKVTAVWRRCQKLIFVFFLRCRVCSPAHAGGVFLGEATVEETYDRMFTVTSRVRFSVTKDDDGVPVDCVIDHPAAKDLLAQRHLEVLCE